MDHLPFEVELNSIVLLSCGDMCVDAGLRAPKTKNSRNVWSQLVSDAPTHCIVDWPRWTGIFNGKGRQLDNNGTVIDNEEGRGRRRSRFLYEDIKEKIAASLDGATAPK